MFIGNIWIHLITDNSTVMYICFPDWICDAHFDCLVKQRNLTSYLIAFREILYCPVIVVWCKALPLFRFEISLSTCSVQIRAHFILNTVNKVVYCRIEDRLMNLRTIRQPFTTLLSWKHLRSFIIGWRCSLVANFRVLTVNYFSNSFKMEKVILMTVDSFSSIVRLKSFVP